MCSGTKSSPPACHKYTNTRHYSDKQLHPYAREKIHCLHSTLFLDVRGCSIVQRPVTLQHSTVHQFLDVVDVQSKLLLLCHLFSWINEILSLKHAFVSVRGRIPSIATPFSTLSMLAIQVWNSCFQPCFFHLFPSVVLCKSIGKTFLNIPDLHVQNLLVTSFLHSIS